MGQPAHVFRDESEEHVVRRLEAFSDIIIGFSLAELTLNLVLPNDVADLYTKYSVTLVAFGMTFAVIVGMWWSHHQVFTHFFVPTPTNIVLNFLSLFGVMFLAYTLQVWVHSARHHEIAYAMYACSAAWIMGILAFLTRRGIALRGDRMRSEIVLRARRRSMRLALISITLVLLGVSSIVLRSSEMTKTLMILGGALAILLRFADAIALRVAQGKSNLKA